MSKLQDEPPSQITSTSLRLLWTGIAAGALALLSLLLKILQTRAKRRSRHPQQTSEVLAVINNSGSTNTPGSTLTIHKDGSGSITYEKRTQGERFGHYQDKVYPAGTFESSQLENLLTQIQDVSTIPNRDCLKSVSFGSTTTITYQGKTSGDLSCLNNQDPQSFLDLKDLVQKITSHV
jgi:hypothetical protein